MNNLNLSVYRSFIVSLILCLSPSNIIGYISPFVFLILVIMYNINNSKIIFRNIVIFLFFIINVIVFYKFIDNKFVIGNSLIFVITYGSFVPVIIIPNKFFANKQILNNIIKIIIPIMFIECFLGIFQSIYGVLSTGSFDLSNII